MAKDHRDIGMDALDFMLKGIQMSIDKDKLTRHLMLVIDEGVGDLLTDLAFDLDAKTSKAPSKMCAELAVDAIEECEVQRRRMNELTILLERARELLHNVADYHHMKRQDLEEPCPFGNGRSFDKHIQQFLDDSHIGSTMLVLASTRDAEAMGGG
tara:strand:- start:74 stop:538 length:465 start_codon:yes stop_codon:yes gene_type:complete